LLAVDKPHLTVTCAWRRAICSEIRSIVDRDLLLVQAIGRKRSPTWVSSLFVRRNGKWVNALYQHTQEQH
jgi:hypothetical protein